ncbi:MAG TPA: SRPBCC family protein [Chroococcales cyanobacterium]
MRASVRLARPIQNLIVSSLAVALFSAPASAKDQQPIKESIVINAPPETVFNIIRKQRNSNEMHRHQKSFDGKVAVIDENMEGVTVYGKVHCVWQETEQPYTRIDFKMLESDKFKSGFGSWILTPSQDGNQTTLEFDNFLDSGLKIPFAGQITKMAAHGDAKKRLEHIKEVAEAETRKESSK